MIRRIWKSCYIRQQLFVPNKNLTVKRTQQANPVSSPGCGRRTDALFVLLPAHMHVSGLIPSPWASNVKEECECEKKAHSRFWNDAMEAYKG
ncbi:hypothetical protein IF2G_00291 [Cordyceps javanica]|nr:hypothetical protein IF2G_00291 [Cordyceps javanica]